MSDVVPALVAVALWAAAGLGLYGLVWLAAQRNGIGVNDVVEGATLEGSEFAPRITPPSAERPRIEIDELYDAELWINLLHRGLVAHADDIVAMHAYLRWQAQPWWRRLGRKRPPLA